MAASRAGLVLEHLRRLLGPGGEPPPDQQLLQRFVARGEEEAFAELVRRHGPLVFGACRRVLGDGHDAEDVFQATFLVLARKAGSVRKQASVAGFLHGVACRLALKARAAAARRRLREREAAAMRQAEAPAPPCPELRSVLDEELSRLPEKQRAPLLLCYLEGNTQEEAARHLGWPRGTLKRRLESGRERLRARLTRRGLALSAGLFGAALTEAGASAAVPGELTAATVRGGPAFAAGEAMSGRAVTLAKEVLHAMFTARLKVGGLVVLVLGLAAAGAGLATRHVRAARPVGPQPVTAAANAPGQGDDRQARVDRHGDPLPEGAVARLGTARFRHRRMPICGLFTRDGKTAVVGDLEGLIIFWDLASGKEVRRIKTPASVYALALSADGKRLASGTFGRVHLWDASTGKLLSEGALNNDLDAVRQIVFAPDGKTIALRDQNNLVYLRDAVGNKGLHVLKGHPASTTGLAFVDGGKTLASSSLQDPHIRFWDVTTGKEVRRVKAHDRGVHSLALAPDGKTLASTGDDSELRFHDAATGQELRHAALPGLAQSLTYFPDGKTLAAIYNGNSVGLWDAATGKKLRTFPQRPDSMAGLAVAPDGKTVATFWSGTKAVELWDPSTGLPRHRFAGHWDSVACLLFADGRALYSGAGVLDGSLIEWDARTGKERRRLGNGGAAGLALSPDGRTLAAGGYTDNTIRLWDLTGGKEARRLEGHRFLIDSVAWSADGRVLASGSYDEQTIRLWDPAGGKQRRAIKVGEDSISPVALSPDGALVAAGSHRSGAVRLWRTATGDELPRLPPTQRQVYAVAFSPDGQTLASGGEEGSICLWQVRTGKLLRQFPRRTGWVGHLAFSADGRTLVSGDEVLRLWEVATGEERARFGGNQGNVKATALSPDGRLAASGGEDSTILVWDVTRGLAGKAAPAGELKSLWDQLAGADAARAHRAVWALALSPDRALPFLRQRLRPPAAPDAAGRKRIARLIGELDDDEFAVRDRAESELEKLGAAAEPALRRAAAGRPTLEAARRMERVLARLGAWSGERLRQLRALEAVESMRTAEAREFLRSLARGQPDAWLTREAGTSLDRLTRPGNR